MRTLLLSLMSSRVSAWVRLAKPMLARAAQPISSRRERVGMVLFLMEFLLFLVETRGIGSLFV